MSIVAETHSPCSILRPLEGVWCTAFADKLHFASITDSTNPTHWPHAAVAHGSASLPMSSGRAVAAAITSALAAGEGLYVSVLLRPQNPASLRICR